MATELPLVRQDEYLQSLEQDASSVAVLRLVFMNRWVADKEAGGKTYLDDFLDRLETAADEWIAQN